MSDSRQALRVDWVDCAKGITIILVVMMHSTLGVQSALNQEGFMGEIIEFARTFRMPLFFVVAGLFLSRTISRPWVEYLDRKILHFAYFYLLWSVIQISLKIAMGGGSHHVGLNDLLMVPIQPFGTIWFIYVLPLFFLATRLFRALPTPAVLAFAFILNLLPVQTGWIAVDAFAHYYIFFLAGYLGAPGIFLFAQWLRENSTKAILGVLGFSALNILAIKTGIQDWSGLSILLSFAGVGALVSVCVTVAGTRAGSVFRYCGEHSLYIYVAFFLPMAVSRIIAIRTGYISNVDLVSMFVTASAVAGTLIMYYIAMKTPFSFLYKRPSFLKLGYYQFPELHGRGTAAGP